MVQLRDVAGALIGSDPFRSFYDRANDTVTWVHADVLATAEEWQDGDDLVEAARLLDDGSPEALEKAIRIVDNDGTLFVALPTQWDVHEYSIMEDFVLSLPESNAQDRLWSRIHGSGAFRKFKDDIHRFDLAETWYAFREERLTKIALEWAEKNDIPLTDSVEAPDAGDRE